MFKKAIKVIVNADDLGAYPEVDSVIFQLMDARRVTSGTLIAAGPTFQHAVRAAKSRPSQSFGVHLNLTVFKPLTNGRGIDSLLDNDGSFQPDLCRLRLQIRRRCVRDAIYAEWRAQILAVLETGLCVSHLDSHQHVHTSPALFGVLKRLQREFGIRRVRITRNEPGSTINWLKLCSKNIWNFALRHYYHTITTQGMCSLAEFYETALAGSLRYDLYEIMVHPGPAVYVKETELLTSPWETRLPYEIRFVTFSDRGEG